MRRQRSNVTLLAAVCAAMLAAGTIGTIGAEQAPAPGAALRRAAGAVAAGALLPVSSPPPTSTRMDRSRAASCCRRSRNGSPTPTRQRRRDHAGTARRGVERGAAAAAARRRPGRRDLRRAEREPADAVSGPCRQDDGRTAGRGAGQAGQAAQGARAGGHARVRALVDSARRRDGRGARQQDEGVDDDRHLQRERHHRGESQAVRRRVPRQHDRLFPRRAGGQGRNRRAPRGVALVREKRKRARGRPRGDRSYHTSCSGGRGAAPARPPQAGAAPAGPVVDVAAAPRVSSPVKS